MTTSSGTFPAARMVGVSRAGDRWFFCGMALAIVLTVFWGFLATFYARGAALPPLSPLLVAHGIAFSAWVIVFAVQTALIAANRRALHRRVGMSAAFLAVLMVGLGLAAAVAALRLGRAPIPGLDPRSFFVVPFFDISIFAILVGAGLWLRRDRETHQRLMLLGMIGLIDAAIARIPLHFIQTGGPPVFFGLTDLFVLAAMAYDFATRRRVHRAYVWGGLLIILSQPLRLIISGTAAWLWFAGLFL